MESNRSGDQLKRPPAARRQAGITLIGFLLLAAVFGTLGLAVIKIVPLYLEKMSIGAVLENMKDELGTGGNSPASIRFALDNRFYVENLEPLTADELDIQRAGQVWVVNVTRETRAPFLADLYFVVAINERVELSQ